VGCRWLGEWAGFGLAFAGFCRQVRPFVRGCHLNRAARANAIGASRLPEAAWVVSSLKLLGLVAEVPSKLARAGGSRPDFGPEKKQKNTQKPLIKSKLNQN